MLWYHLLKVYFCGSSLVAARSWGNILHVFTASITIHDTGHHILFLVASIDNLHVYRYQKINVIDHSGMYAKSYLEINFILTCWVECGDGFCHSIESCELCINQLDNFNVQCCYTGEGCKADCCPFQLHHFLLVIAGSFVVLVMTSTVILMTLVNSLCINAASILYVWKVLWVFYFVDVLFCGFHWV